MYVRNYSHMNLIPETTTRTDMNIGKNLGTIRWVLYHQVSQVPTMFNHVAILTNTTHLQVKTIKFKGKIHETKREGKQVNANREQKLALINREASTDSEMISIGSQERIECKFF